MGKGIGVAVNGIVGTSVGKFVAVRVGRMIGALVCVDGTVVGAALQAPSIMLKQLRITTTRLREFMFTCKPFVIQTKMPAVFGVLR
jgi:hypothetical protein